MNITELAIYKKMFGGSGGTNGDNGGTSETDELIGKWVFNSEPLDMSYLTTFTTHFDGVIDARPITLGSQIFSRTYGLSCSTDLALVGNYVVQTKALIKANGTFAEPFNGEMEILAVISATDAFRNWLKANATKVS